MESLPPALLDFISAFRPLMRTEVFDSFTYLLCGLLIGEAKHGTVRASVFAPPTHSRSACRICSAATRSRGKH